MGLASPSAESVRNSIPLPCPWWRAWIDCPTRFPKITTACSSDDLRIGAGQVSAAYLLPEYLKRFRENNATARIDVKTGTGQQRLDWLRSHELDLVVAAMDIPPPDLEFHPVVESELVLITPEDHPLAGRDSVTLEEMAVYPFVGHTTGHYTRQITDVILRLYGFTPKVAAEVNGWGVIMNYVAAGVGIAAVPDVCLTGHDRVRKIRLEGVVPRTQVRSHHAPERPSLAGCQPVSRDPGRQLAGCVRRAVKMAVDRKTNLPQA